MPIRELLQGLDPAPGKEVIEAADKFKYRDFLTVALVVKGRDLFPDNWIYVHDSNVRVGRIQNFKNWSPEMVPDPETTCLGLEYFCFEGDDLWTMADDDLIELGRDEMARLGLVDKDRFLDGTVVRMPKAYPVYDQQYREGLATLRRFLEQVPNLQLVGRNGMHHYNNQDHSMLTGIYAARNLLGGNYDLWSVNVEEDYHEAGERVKIPELESMSTTQPRVPGRKLTPSA
jgi:protoporphyrinogen oxidase